ncbi:hypothetical protein RO3G_08420 [Rhizopus delemar RA 99-880]|uniref:Uncharacterized protein n=1 Tax=Rhizopus delemar (strain RA 99-880 / ATCC MYA-4621 / FGSC 9543 / NRRL 43880) TaxID=246409 RepID=I1C5I5_RHIO9|nr:hypothetical protein RO3G_08420 [Rhizopus delemar RA 99-880]|eukprot:EIE83715.1 hypothetical protein RO3G_08420 [Rhizopus delemar RA 99-880]
MSLSGTLRTALNKMMKTQTTNSARILKATWLRWVTEVANEMNITLNFTHDNWYIVENCLQQLENVSTMTPVPASLETMSLSQRTTFLDKSIKSLLKISLSEDDKRRVFASYNSLVV